MAVQQAPGLVRTDLQQHDLSIPGYEVVQNRLDLFHEGDEARLLRLELGVGDLAVLHRGDERLELLGMLIDQLWVR